MFSCFFLLYRPPSGLAFDRRLAQDRATCPSYLVRHPPLSLPLRRFDAVGTSWIVRVAADGPAFASHTRSNLLYLDSDPPLPSDACVLRVTGLGADVSYQEVSLNDNELAAELQQGPGVLFSPTPGRLYREMDSHANRAVPVDVRVGAVKQGRSVLNPLLLRFERDGSELGDSGPDLVRLLREHGELLACEPALEADVAARVAARRELANRLRQRGRPLSVADQLLFGCDFLLQNDRPSSGRPTDDWGQAALGLDALNGVFTVLDAGAAGACLAWSPPGQCSANESWLAERWLRQWAGPQPATAATVPISRLLAPEPELQGLGPSIALHVTQAELPSVLAAASNLLARLEPPHLPPVAFVIGLLGSGGPGVAQGSHWGAVNYDPAGQSVEVNQMRLVDQFARRHVLPRSPVRFVFPAAFDAVRNKRPDRQTADWLAEACRGLALDLGLAPAASGWAFLCRYLSALEEPLQLGCADVPFRFGWWADWYDRLFDVASGGGVRFDVPPGVFILQQSYLDEASLGPGLPDYDPRHPFYL